MSAFPQDMLLYPSGQPRILNSDNRIRGEINDVAFVVDVKGGMAICGFVNRKTGEERRMFQPLLNVIGIVLGCAEIASGQKWPAEYVSLRPGPGDENLLSGH